MQDEWIRRTIIFIAVHKYIKIPRMQQILPIWYAEYRMGEEGTKRQQQLEALRNQLGEVKKDSKVWFTQTRE